MSALLLLLYAYNGVTRAERLETSVTSKRAPLYMIRSELRTAQLCAAVFVSVSVSVSVRTFASLLQVPKIKKAFPIFSVNLKFLNPKFQIYARFEDFWIRK